MKLQISNQKYISKLQAEFSAMFPFLKVEFFSKPHKIGKGTSKDYMTKAATTIGACRTTETEGDLEFDSSITVNELESKFKEQFGLNVQVFRKSGKLWLETTATDNWTLAAQNKQGEELDYVQDDPKDEEIDYHEQE
ncbi:MAG: hypothetical protein SGI87_05110 [Flavobacteriales bacterium]|nr:hypothetical protein [Flavobacteriales bacterium]